jgi:hypothetical protein|tara:strand:- start:1248 stop:1535 length:288 start_codon:yes stop_codon:yes gene_type:complete
MKKWFSLGIVLFFCLIALNWLFKSEDNTEIIAEIDSVIVIEDALDTILVNEHESNLDSLCFDGAFKTARHLYGPDSTFMWYGNEYHTKHFEEILK